VKERSQLLLKLKRLAESFGLKGEKVGILATDETEASYKALLLNRLKPLKFVNIAQNLFRLLREIDAQNVDVIIAEGVSFEGIGLAVMNRLRKASGYHIIKIE
jgi:L-threonylcarbamoyladenylate synthase